MGDFGTIEPDSDSPSNDGNSTALPTASERCSRPSHEMLSQEAPGGVGSARRLISVS
jgi:hypothetical protein